MNIFVTSWWRGTSVPLKVLFYVWHKNNTVIYGWNLCSILGSWDIQYSSWYSRTQPRTGCVREYRWTDSWSRQLTDGWMVLTLRHIAGQCIRCPWADFGGNSNVGRGWSLRVSPRDRRSSLDTDWSVCFPIDFRLGWAVAQPKPLVLTVWPAIDPI